MGAPRITETQKESFRVARRDGNSIARSAQIAKVSEAWAKAYERDLRNSSGREWREARKEADLPGPIPYEDLGPEASRALNDFEFFRLRYFGHVSSPWQVDAARRMVEFLESPDKEYVVINCPPGAGKTALFTHDIPAWLTCRDRTITGIIGSRTFRQAEIHAARLKRTFERVLPVQAKDEDKKRGLAVDAESTLARDFGRFKPASDEMWQKGQFFVAQQGEAQVAEKEPTWTAFGQDSGSLGWRVRYATWDDVFDKSLRTIESIENQREWWDDEAETRLEPGGVLALPMQRLRSNDISRYCLNKRIAVDADDDDGEGDLQLDEDSPRQYHHIIYKVHYDDLCRGIHKPSEALPYPDGCLLDPVRIPWRDVRTAKGKPKFALVWQQEDVDDADVLVSKSWIDGSNEHPGCWDKNRGLAEIPPGLSGDKFSVVTADPSPTRFWSIQWWLYHPDSEFRYLLDLIRQGMDAPDFLDWNYAQGVYTGVLEEWWQRSYDLGDPITHVIVEANAAQRFMLQYDHVRRWSAKRGVQIIPHQTHRNKSDESYGVQSIAPHYEFGRVRLPGKQGNPGRIAAMKLVDEVTRWPEGETDDCVMAHWFMEWQLPNIYVPSSAHQMKLKRPSWMRRAS